MDRNDPRYRLVEFVDTDLKAGVSMADVVRKLQECGLEESAAKSMVEFVKKSRTDHKVEIAKFAVGAMVIAFSLISGIYYFLGEAVLIGLAWPLLGLFIVCWGTFIALASNAGRLAANARRMLSYLTFLASSSLSGALFLQSDWVARETAQGASWRYYILKFIFDAVYSIGPKVFSIMFLLLSAAMLLISWAEFHKFKNRHYGKM